MLDTMYLFILLLVPASTLSDSSYGINLPHGSITFYGPNYGDNRRIELPDFESPTTRSSSNYVTSFKPSYAVNFNQWTPITSSPTTFYNNPYPTTTSRPQIQANNPNFFSLSYDTNPKQSNTRFEVQNPSLTSFTQGPINSAVPISLFYPEFPETKTSTRTTTLTTTRTTTRRTTTKAPTPTTPALGVFKLDFDFSNIGSQKGSRRISHGDDKTTLEDVYVGRKSVKKASVNDIPLNFDNRKTRKVDFSSPSGKNITALIQKALKLVKKVEEIDERKKALQSTLKSVKSKKNNRAKSDSRPKESSRSKDESIEDLREELRELKEEKKFDNLKSFIQDQSSIANLIKSETSDIKDFLAVTTKNRAKDAKDTKTTKEMINALARLNSISSLLLKENDKTKSTVRELPDEIRGIVQDEVVSVKKLLEDQNIAVASALRSAIVRQADREDRRVESSSETDVVILKALAKLNNIAGILLKEQEKTEEKTTSALKALPALAKFIQAETTDIKDLIVENEDDFNRNDDLEELKDAVSQSLANDKLITRAIIKLNDITQLLLRDVNFTTSAITNKLPEALTALITHETGKIRKMIDLQNDAIVDILKESDNLARAEKVIQEAQKIKKNLGGENILDLFEEKPVRKSDKLLELIGPFLSDDESEEVVSKSSRADKLVEILGPLLKNNQNIEEDLEEEVKEIDNETETVLKAQLAGQKSIVQALLKLTNITRTLLDEKENESQKEESRSSRLTKQNEFRDNDDSEEFDGEDYEDYYDNPVKRLRSNKPKSLVETIASSPGNRALRGNQALFEEFVKLAIERQRWEQAQDVTRIIQSTIPEYSDYYDYPAERRPFRRPSQRPKGASRNRPKRPKFEDYYSYESIEESEENVKDSKRPSVSSKRPFKSQNRPSFRRPEERPQERQENEDSRESEESFPRRFRPPKSFRQQRPAKKITTTTSTTTTEEPLEYEESYYYDIEDYPSTEEREEISAESIEEEKISAESLEEKTSKSFTSDTRAEEQRRPSLNQLLNQRPSGKRKPLFQPRGRPRPRFGENSKETKTERPSSVPSQTPTEQTIEAKEVESIRPRFRPGRPSLNDEKLEEKKKETTQEQDRPRFRPGRPSQNPRTFRPGRRNNPRLNGFPNIQAEEGDVTDGEDQTPVDSEEVEREDLLQKLLSHSKSSEKSTIQIRPEVNVQREIEQDRSGGILQDSPQLLRKESKKELNPLERLIKTAEHVSNLSAKQSSTTERIVTSKNPPSSPVPVRVSTDDFRPTALQNVKPDPVPVVTTTATPTTTQTTTTLRITTTTNPIAPATEETRRVPFPTSSSRRSKPLIGSRKPTTTEDNQVAEVTSPRESRPSRTQSITSGRRRPVFRPGNRRTSPPTPTPLPTASTTAETVRDINVRPVFRGNRRPVTAPARTDVDARPGALPLPVEESVLRSDDEEKENRRASFPRRNSPLTRTTPKTTQAPATDKEKDVLPLSDTERKSKKQERNNLFKKLLSGRNEERTTTKPVVNQIPTQEKEMSPLENLFNIIQSNQETPEKPEPSVRVTSSSSSSSSRSVSSSSSSSSVRSSSSSTGGRRKKVKKSTKSHLRSTGDRSLQQLSPQERLVKKVQETLRNESDTADTEARDIVRPRNSRKKVIFRKRKDEEVDQSGQLPRIGRQFKPGSSQIKSVKVRVRRIEEIPPFPIVY